MQIEGKFSLQGDIREIWDFLLDAGTLVSCIPGAEKVQAIDDKTYECVVKQKVGPISVKFQFVTTLAEVRPPTFVKAVGKGSEAAKLGNFAQVTLVNLKEMPEHQVEVSYVSDVSVVGRLATFGERIMRAKSKEVGEEFTRNLRKKLETRTAAAAK